MRKPCRCHSSDLYAGLVECPWCRHRSFDLIAGSCERKKCALEFPVWPDNREQQRELWVRARKGDLSFAEGNGNI